MPERIPSREELRGAMLWLARMLVSYDGKPYTGPILVRVKLTEEGESCEFEPKGTTDGMMRPSWFALGEEGEFGVELSELLGAMVSPDEEKLLADLLAHQPCSASSVHERCKGVMSKSEFWAAWAQLQGRRLVVEDDERYRVGPEWLVKWLRARRGESSSAA